MPYLSELKNLCEKLGCGFLTEEPLSMHTTFRVGGCCRVLIYINSIENLVKLLLFIKTNNIKYFVLGKGSNVIASDDGFDGVVLVFGSDFSSIKFEGKNELVCSAGISLKDLCLFALERELTGLEFAYGIPGTAGGALFMNAGAYGGEMSDVVVSAEYIDEDLNLCCIEKADMKLSYRHSIFSENRNYIITSICLKLEQGSGEEIRVHMDELLHRRKDKQPLNYPSAGSTFKRPEGSYASLLIDQCGLKGMNVGGAEVSCKHSGFIINKGNATCSDILKLSEKVIEIVKSKTGYVLELEPEILK